MSAKSILSLLALSLVCFNAQAGSASALSISDSISTSVGSLSDSISGISHSVKGAVALNEGEYHVVEVAQADADDKVRLTLQPVGNDDPEAGLYLQVRTAAVTAAGVRQGDVISAQERPYGIAMYGAAADVPFVLLLADAWRDRIDARPVTL
ncbi:MAG: hypothetical protein CGU28_09650 [Candidatus Dactylopiibacterium carminicum]|uniref:Uncharacterized protein n=1 Tax=Candidatus Dactylopiibacterium carminicum TaxID=857335 RepID=A0A272ERN5_9RHOO|nr:hypothetical protein [Candidatus Dactylopiibacterium carminicum]KAF7598849.1 hypothetical protein BGI27_10980 [Candidatus Dactylopiibacterium carminicum]PAS92765.1 MAG: hypothetical protein CGU29_10240 [Candidatus Dactylopiibacterium carminicum]PAS96215.1 MAG: hypothetical protein CGU28_09650 [Candidatus Dactylopiibacterium carminicum]PAS98867.1 MAG: hypothetical protein BSR46_11000 [Candidatus Dactylopiibacterium carminicum]